MTQQFSHAMTVELAIARHYLDWYTEKLFNYDHESYVHGELCKSRKFYQGMIFAIEQVSMLSGCPIDEEAVAAQRAKFNIDKEEESA